MNTNTQTERFMANNQRVRDDYSINFKQIDDSRHLITLFDADTAKDSTIILSSHICRFIADVFAYAYRTSNLTNLEYIFKCVKELEN